MAENGLSVPLACRTEDVMPREFDRYVVVLLS